MIAPMKRVFVLLAPRDKREGLRELRRLGVLHLEPMSGVGGEYEELVAARDSVREALGLLSEFKAEPSTDDMSAREGIELAAAIRGFDADAKSAYADTLVIVREMERIRSWGDFDPALASSLAEKGVPLRFAEIPIKKIPSIPEALDYVLLGQAKGQARLAFLAGPGVELPLDCVEFRTPEKSLSTLEAESEHARSRSETAREAIAAKAPLAGVLGRALAKIEREEAFEAARSGMASGEGVAWFSAWVPAKDEKRLSDAAAKAGWGLLLDDPLDEEQPPTKIENNAIVRMIQPVFDFLGTVPNYREYDISALFLIFFTIFFAMIFGDGGYGSIMFVAGLALAVKAKASGKPVPDFIRLLLVMSGTTVIWGALTMSWFGMPVEKIPSVLQSLSVDWISNANPESGDNVKVLCFMLGLVQLSIAHIKNIAKEFPSPKFLGQLGQLAMVDGMFFLVLNLVISATKYPLPMWALYTVGVGFVLNFMFAGYEGGKNFFAALGKSVLASAANIVSVFLGVVNIFADIVSYIRLWAVGLAGLAISQTVNNMAGPMFGKAIMFVAGVSLLVFGHGLNIIMSVLSVIVHGVRLNVLEFSSHLGMEWSGYKYEPFRDTVQIERAEMERSLS
ncbi:MAG: hypothetical protein CVV47_05230 [Spirochaetae bacterium HGW-Spirochaetae-3]|jgi:V/A-type H+-transporting ATPase subunit I|nr:MAG: hypothetical protein CVV47_05230 [Spirochaetae bacterium HGW-Spirochaetae-3]